MQSKTSWFNREIVIQSFRNVGWVSIVYLVGLLLILPLQLIMIWSNQQEYNHWYYTQKNVFTINFELQLILLFLIPVLLGMFLYRYLQMKSASDFIHSLPISRTQIYTQYFIIGIVYLLIPVLITAIMLFVLQGPLEMGQLYTKMDVLEWAGLTFSNLFVIYAACVFIGTLTGITAVQGVLTYILLLFPAGITALFYLNAQYFLFGFEPDYYFNMRLERFSPITAAPMIQNSNSEIGLTQGLIYLLAGILFYVVGMLIYKRRKVEGVAQALVFQQMKPVFKYGVTFCTMLVGGVYFGETQHSIIWILVGYGLGSIAGYLVAEMILHKTWRVFNQLKGYVIYVLVAGLAILILQFDVTGFENHVPAANKIDRIYFGQHAYAYTNQDDAEFESVEKPYLETEENIQAVRKLHQQIIENKDDLDDLFRYRNHISHQTVFLAYELKNGDKIIREYHVPPTDEFQPYLKPIYESMEYKAYTEPVLSVNTTDVTRITVHPDKPLTKQNQGIIIQEPEKIEEAIQALKEDIKNQPYTDYLHRGLESNIQISLSGDREGLHTTFSKSFTNFETWLEKEGLLKQARTTVEDIDYAIVLPTKKNRDPYDFHQISFEELLKRDGGMKITSKAELQQTMDTVMWQDPMNPYVVIFKYKDSKHRDIRSFNEYNVPDFIKKHFE
ncbi:DUF6449 domain-containing protein [Pseudalkalibacillus sp. SCS-8]|uniref:DUF6449 domain-containing protein n=1 Tax=Pseudalkalibacillus nanhaiensis TaxID=3115291 RepID=UPI0032DA8358